MKYPHFVTAVAALTAFSMSAHADIAIDVIGGSEVSLEGLMQADANWFHNDRADLNAPSTSNDGKDTEFEQRRAEVVLKGKGTSFDWVAGYDGKANKWLDANVKWKLGSSYLIAGQFKQPNSLEELSSTKNNDFIAKAMVTNLFGVARRVGVAYAADEPNWGYSVNAFGRELTRNLGEGAGYGGRAYWAPFNAPGQLLHLGVSAVDYDTHKDTLRLRARPDADLATTRLVDSANLVDADRQRTFGLEGVWVGGPFKVQSEYMRSRITRLTHPNYTGDSWYVHGIWNITGETWGYKAGVPTTPLPNEPGSGMWQLGVRYDKTDLDDGSILPPISAGGFPTTTGVLGGTESNITVGLNWYWRSNFKIMFNYVKVTSDRFTNAAHKTLSDDPNILETRVQFYW